ncbi:hypothetical protein BZA70DRAFT_202005 [Myxozyma melibiosi]|uniref:Uncharacterized protein n=1 Tax=Myxozyma melibiosi TaxID=54550 RepID=A0ABR1F2Q6_9ASCO
MDVDGRSSHWIRRLKDAEAEIAAGKTQPTTTTTTTTTTAAENRRASQPAATQIALKQLARTVEDLSATGQTLFQALVALQRRRHETQKIYADWYENYKRERSRVSELAAELEREAGRERQARERAERERDEAREEERRVRGVVEEGRMELTSARMECRRAWAEVARLEEQNRVMQITIQQQYHQQRIVVPSSATSGAAELEREREQENEGEEAYLADEDEEGLEDDEEELALADESELPTTSYPASDPDLSGSESESSVPGGRYIPEQQQQMGGSQADEEDELQRRMQTLEMEYWAQQQKESYGHRRRAFGEE